MSSTFGISESALLIHSKRVGLISRNIANADTPGFKAQTVNFKDALSSSAKSLDLSVSSEKHINFSSSATPKYRVPNQLSLDGNTVELDVEKMELMEATQQYDTALQFINGAIDTKLTIIQGSSK